MQGSSMFWKRIFMQTLYPGIWIWRKRQGLKSSMGLRRIPSLLRTLQKMANF